VKILILCESLKINSSSAGIVNSNFIYAMKELKYDILVMHDEVNDEFEFLSGIETIKIVEKSIKKPFLEKIPKLRALPAYITGFGLLFLAAVKRWKISIELLLEKEHFDLIILLGSGSSFLPYFAMEKISTTVPWIAHIHDPYPLSQYPEP